MVPISITKHTMVFEFRNSNNFGIILLVSKAIIFSHGIPKKHIYNWNLGNFENGKSCNFEDPEVLKHVQLLLNQTYF